MYRLAPASRCSAPSIQVERPCIVGYLVSFSSSVEGGERRKMTTCAAFARQQDGPSLSDRSLIPRLDRTPQVVLDKLRSLYMFE
jgi:hypothetical protein